MIRSKSSCHHCGGLQRVRARDVSMVIHHGHLVGEEEARDKRLQPLRYDTVEFCSNRTCERVFRAERKAA